MKIKGNCFIIAGAASGMGACVAEQLAELEAELILIDRNESALTALAHKLSADYIVNDVSTEACATALSALLAQKTDYPAGLINCAGIATAAKLLDKTGEPVPLAHFEQVIAVNLLGALNLMRITAAWMKKRPLHPEQGRGIIIHTASIAAYEGQVGQVAYSATKAGILGSILPAARELAEYGIRVNAIAPGLIDTPLLQNLPEKVTVALQQSIPFPKRFGTPQEFAKLAIHIIENTLINGATLRLDGALRMK